VRKLAVFLVVVLAAAGGALAAKRLSGRAHAASLSVRIGGRSVRVAEGTTLGALARQYALHPHAGALLDVNRRPLRRNAIPGKLLLNGAPAVSSHVLQSGDRVTVVNGAARMEPTVRTVQRIRGGMPTDPQFSVAYVGGKEVIVRGAISHELVSARFVPDGAVKAKRAVALTFDDGPWPSSTPEILDELRKLHVHATFFVIGYLAEASPQLVRLEVQRGMVVGNHSYNHPQVPPFSQLPAPLLRDEITLTQAILRRLGVETHLFRPPGGATSPAVVRAAQAAGDRVVLWSVDPADWEAGITASEIVQRVLSTVRAGSIVILHDGGGDRTATLHALPAIVRGIRRRGLSLVTLDSIPPG